MGNNINNHDSGEEDYTTTNLPDPNSREQPDPDTKPRRIRTVSLVAFFMAAASLFTIAVISVFGLHSDLITVLPRSEAAYYSDFRENYAELLQLKDYVEKNYYVPPDEEDLKLGMYKGLFEGLDDPYSEYLTAKELEDAMISTSGHYEGIGVSIVPDEQGYINVVAPIEGTPAEKIGVKAGDKIIKIDGVEYTGESIDKAVSMMRGEPGSSVKITVLRGKDVLDFDIVRAAVTMKSVKSEMLQNKIGYIRVTSFESATAKDFKTALTELEKKKAAGLVIDLRGNPGGLVEQSVKVADMLVDSGILVYTENQAGEREEYKGTSGKTSLPYVVLIDKGSASSSEILAGAVKDTKSGKLIGTTTFGKGIIQQMIPLNNGDGIKLTIAQYFSPNGNVIHKNGIEPDIEVALKESDYVDGTLPRENDRQLNVAIGELLK